MNTVTISNDKMAITVYRYSQSDFLAERKDLQGTNPFEVCINSSGNKKEIWFDNKEEFDFFAEAMASYYDEFRKEDKL